MLPGGMMAWNGTTWERWRGPANTTLLASAARTTTTSSATQTNYSARGLLVQLLVTSAGTGTLTVSITSSTGFAVAGFTAVSASTAFLLYPGVEANLGLANSKSGALPRAYTVTVTKSDASSWTYTLYGDTIL